MDGSEAGTCCGGAVRLAVRLARGSDPRRNAVIPAKAGIGLLRGCRALSPSGLSVRSDARLAKEMLLPEQDRRGAVVVGVRLLLEAMPLVREQQVPHWLPVAAHRGDDLLGFR